MTDLHSHILPGIDDGAQTVEDSLALLREQVAQGVDQIALTPHFNAERITVSEFIERRAESFEQLQKADWVITYDDCPAILDLYHDHVCRRMSWNYSAATKRPVEEIVIFRNEDMIPTKKELCTHKVQTILHDIDVMSR